MTKHDVGHFSPRPTRAGDIELTFVSGEEEYVLALSPEAAVDLLQAIRHALESDGHLPKPNSAN